MLHDWFPASGGGLLGTMWTANDLRVILMKPTYAPNPDTHKVYADVSAEELPTAGGYTAGGVALANKSVVYTAATDRTDLLADDTVWAAATFTTRYAIIFDNTGATKPLWSLIDYEANKDVVAGTFTIDWAAVGLLYVAKAA